MNHCSYCKQIQITDDPCPCRNFKCWFSDMNHTSGKLIRASNFKFAAEEYAEMNDDRPADGEEIEVTVKNFQGKVKKFLVVTELQIEYTAEEIKEEAVSL